MLLLFFSTPAAARGDQPARPPAQALFRGDMARLGRTAGSLPRRAPQVRWRLPGGRAIFGSPAIDERGRIYIGSEEGWVFAVAPGGRLRWQTRTGGAVSATPMVTEAAIIVGSTDGHL